MNTPDILQKILDRKREDLISLKREMPLSEIRAQAESMPVSAGFKVAIHSRIKMQQPAVIAEIKKASPSKGIIREVCDVTEIAKAYEEGGATCLSVLTEEHYFLGHPDNIQLTKASCRLPVLRKDFVLDPYQIYETKVLGADCLLLIVSALERSELKDFSALALECGLDVLIEVHDEAECEKALEFEHCMLGINNRDLRTFQTDLSVTERLLTYIPEGRCVVTESGIHTKDDVTRMLSAGVYAFLVGEAFMRSTNPGKALQMLFKQSV